MFRFSFLPPPFISVSTEDYSDFDLFTCNGPDEKGYIEYDFTSESSYT